MTGASSGRRQIIKGLLQVLLQRLLMSPREVIRHDFMANAGADIGVNGNDAASADAQNGNGNIVIAGIQSEIRSDAMRDFHDVRHIAGRLFHSGDFGVLAQLFDHGNGNGTACCP